MHRRPPTSRSEVHKLMKESLGRKESLMNDLFEMSEREAIAGLAQTFQHDDEVELESASMDKPLDCSNVGYRLLMKMGWREGGPLGVRGNGRIAPVRIDLKLENMGLGRKELEEEYVDPDNIVRKRLESEREETDELKARRQNDTMRKEQIKAEVTALTDQFYCKLCDKRYKRISEYEIHLSSYDHNHTKRLMEVRKMTAPFASRIPRDQKEAIQTVALTEPRAGETALVKTNTLDLNMPPPSKPTRGSFVDINPANETPQFKTSRGSFVEISPPEQPQPKAPRGSFVDVTPTEAQQPKAPRGSFVEVAPTAVRTSNANTTATNKQPEITDEIAFLQSLVRKAKAKQNKPSGDAASEFLPIKLSSEITTNTNTTTNFTPTQTSTVKFTFDDTPLIPTQSSKITKPPKPTVGPSETYTSAGRIAFIKSKPLVPSNEGTLVIEATMPALPPPMMPAQPLLSLEKVQTKTKTTARLLDLLKAEAQLLSSSVKRGSPQRLSSQDRDNDCHEVSERDDPRDNRYRDEDRDRRWSPERTGRFRNQNRDRNRYSSDSDSENRCRDFDRDRYRDTDRKRDQDSFGRSKDRGHYHYSIDSSDDERDRDRYGERRRDRDSFGRDKDRGRFLHSSDSSDDERQRRRERDW